MLHELQPQELREFLQDEHELQPKLRAQSQDEHEFHPQPLLVLPQELQPVSPYWAA